jgi:hypothetical protein
MTFTPEAAELLLVIGTTSIACISALAGALVVLPPGESQPMPWWERARRTYPARVAPAISVFVLAQILMPTTMFCFNTFGYRPPVSRFFAIGLGPMIGPVAMAIFMAWLASPRRKPIGYWLAGCISAILFRFPNTLVCAVLALALYLLPHELSTVLLVLLVGAGALAFAAWGGGIWVAQAMGLARPALPRATHAAEWAGERVGVRASKSFEILWPNVRVDAFVFSRYLVFTDSAASLLNDEELLALSIREVTFFQQRWLAGTLRVLDSAMIFFLLCCTAVGATAGGNASMVGALVGVGSALLIRPFVRRVQIKADALAASAAIDPQSALLALARQFELNLQPMVAVSNRSQDAHLYDRMAAAGIAMNYPRPTAPSKGRILLSIATAAVTCGILSIAFLTAVDFIVTL